MTVGALVRGYREENHLSQRQLALRMHVSDMTVSRLETNPEFKLSAAVAYALYKTIGADELRRVDDESAQSEQLKQYLAQFESTDRLQGKRLESRFFEDTVDERIQSTGIPFVKIERSQGRSRQFDLAYRLGEKLWCVETKRVTGAEARGTRMMSMLAECIGNAACIPNINKVSLVIESDTLPDGLTNYIYACSRNVGFDVSVIHYNEDKGCFDYEIDLAFHTDGRGLFDLQVSEAAAESATYFAAWKAALSRKD